MPDTRPIPRRAASVVHNDAVLDFHKFPALLPRITVFKKCSFQIPNKTRLRSYSCFSRGRVVLLHVWLFDQPAVKVNREEKEGERNQVWRGNNPILRSHAVTRDAGLMLPAFLQLFRCHRSGGGANAVAMTRHKPNRENSPPCNQ